MQFVLSSYLSQPVSNFSLGINHSFAAPLAEVLDVSYHGSTGGSDGNNLMRGRQITPSGMVPPPLKEDVISSPYIYISLPVSVASGSVSLFRQNTYLQNKKHTLTCQRWDWLL